MIIHVLDLPFDKAVDALAVRAVREPADHAQPVGPLLFGKQPLDRNHNALSPLLMAVDTDHFLFQTHLRLEQRAVFRLPPPSLQGAGLKMRKRKGRMSKCIGQAKTEQYGVFWVFFLSVDPQHEVTPLEFVLVQRASRELALIQLLKSGLRRCLENFISIAGQLVLQAVLKKTKKPKVLRAIDAI